MFLIFVLKSNFEITKDPTPKFEVRTHKELVNASIFKKKIVSQWCYEIYHFDFSGASPIRQKSESTRRKNNEALVNVSLSK